MVPKIKICGLTRPEDGDLLRKYQVEYAGFVLFYPKSRRNLTLKRAEEIFPRLGAGTQKIAVVVSPTAGQVSEIAKAGFDWIQIHGTCETEVLARCPLPILLAYNISANISWEEPKSEKVRGYVLDGAKAGAGKTFDWISAKDFDRGERLLFLAGGLHTGNVAEGIAALHPDVVDVSSGVEGVNGKDEAKIAAFVNRVRSGAEKKIKQETWQ